MKTLDLGDVFIDYDPEEKEIYISHVQNSKTIQLDLDQMKRLTFYLRDLIAEVYYQQDCS